MLAELDARELGALREVLDASPAGRRDGGVSFGLLLDDDRRPVLQRKVAPLQVAHGHAHRIDQLLRTTLNRAETAPANTRISPGSRIR